VFVACVFKSAFRPLKRSPTKCRPIKYTKTCAWIFGAQFVRTEEVKFYLSGALKELSEGMFVALGRSFKCFIITFLTL